MKDKITKARKSISASFTTAKTVTVNTLALADSLLTMALGVATAVFIITNRIEFAHAIEVVALIASALAIVKGGSGFIKVMGGRK